jgi:hypothetical protein
MTRRAVSRGGGTNFHCPAANCILSPCPLPGALRELGSYYQRNGPRSRLSDEAAGSILSHLDAVEAALPAEKKGLLGL